jgi:hypothetical protein
LLLREISDRDRVPLPDDLKLPRTSPERVAADVARLSQHGLIEAVEGEWQVTAEGERVLARLDRVFTRLQA